MSSLPLAASSEFSLISSICYILIDRTEENLDCVNQHTPWPWNSIQVETARSAPFPIANSTNS